MVLPRSRPELRAAPRTGGRSTSFGSFHASAPIPILLPPRRPPVYLYQTLSAQPQSASTEQSQASFQGAATPPRHLSPDRQSEQTPLPFRQLVLLAILSLSEQTALNSISPYIPEMVASMPGIPSGQTGLYVGILASCFPLAQISTNFFWGYASDVIGRKPILLAGTFSLMCCFCFFGFCKQYWQAVIVHVAMGLFNGNAACVPTILGEITDRTNQGTAFTYLPIIYSLGGITGPALGGILVGGSANQFPYLVPNLVGAALLAVSVVLVAIWFEETLEQDGDQSQSQSWHRINQLFSYFRETGSQLWRKITCSSRPSRSQHSLQRHPLLARQQSSSCARMVGDTEDRDENSNAELSRGEEFNVWKDLWNHTTILLLVTYLVFQLSNVGFSSLFPIFAAASPPTGRQLDPGRIGVSLSFAGIATIVFQAFLYQPVKAKVGNLGTYRLSLLGFAICMLLISFVGHLDDEPLFGIASGRFWLYTELGTLLILKNICAVSGLSGVMLLVFDHNTISRRYA